MTPRTNTDFWRAKLARNRERDEQTDAVLRAAGWTVLRFWEHEEATRVADQVEDVVRSDEARR
jgi:DNA mismatch endonuclease (patch repair protein)